MPSANVYPTYSLKSIKIKVLEQFFISSNQWYLWELFLIMDDHLFFNGFFVYTAAIFSRFIQASSSPSNRIRSRSRFSSTSCPDDYLTQVLVDRQLVQYNLPRDSRTFIHHLSGAACECSLCEVSSLLPVRAHRVRCFYCRVRRCSEFCVRCRSHPNCVDTLPIDVSLADGGYLVTRISPSAANRLLDIVTAFLPFNQCQTELRSELLTLLAMASLTPVVLRRQFERHRSS